MSQTLQPSRPDTTRLDSAPSLPTQDSPKSNLPLRPPTPRRRLRARRCAVGVVPVPRVREGWAGLLGLVLVFGAWFLVLGSWFLLLAVWLGWFGYCIGICHRAHSLNSWCGAGLCCHLPSEAPFQKQGISVSQVGSEQGRAAQGREWSGVEWSGPPKESDNRRHYRQQAATPPTSASI